MPALLGITSAFTGQGHCVRPCAALGGRYLGWALLGRASKSLYLKAVFFHVFEKTSESQRQRFVFLSMDVIVAHVISRKVPSAWLTQYT